MNKSWSCALSPLQCVAGQLAMETAWSCWVGTMKSSPGSDDYCQSNKVKHLQSLKKGSSGWLSWLLSCPRPSSKNINFGNVATSCLFLVLLDNLSLKSKKNPYHHWHVRWLLAALLPCLGETHESSRLV